MRCSSVFMPRSSSSLVCDQSAGSTVFSSETRCLSNSCCVLAVARSSRSEGRRAPSKHLCLLTGRFQTSGQLVEAAGGAVAILRALSRDLRDFCPRVGAGSVGALDVFLPAVTRLFGGARPRRGALSARTAQVHHAPARYLQRTAFRASPGTDDDMTYAGALGGDTGRFE
jgi:hypothetical protein